MLDFFPLFLQQPIAERYLSTTSSFTKEQTDVIISSNPITIKKGNKYQK